MCVVHPIPNSFQTNMAPKKEQGNINLDKNLKMLFKFAILHDSLTLEEILKHNYQYSK